MTQPRQRTPLAALALPTTIGLLAGSATAQGPGESTDGPWRLQSLLGEDSWLHVHGEVRLRYEGIEGQFRPAPGLAGSDHLFVQRTTLVADADLDPAALTLEIVDSRHYGGGVGSNLNTASVNALHILQAFADLDLGELGSGKHRLRAGRATIDLGSRRLVARHGYRNTTNAFTGIDWEWQDDTTTARAFWTLPVRKKPSDPSSVLDNEIELDDQDLDEQFMGAFFAHELDEDHQLEVYAFAVVEDQNLHRELVTPGVRFFRRPSRGAIDYQVEAMYQFGDSRFATAGPDLDHRAWFQQVSVGYTFDTDWSPNLAVGFDHASGDRNPNDGDNDRFDPLYSQQLDLALTGLYRPIIRSNLSSPEVRLTLTPDEHTRVQIGWRGAWLASEQDAWTAAGIQDPTGQAGRHVGQQFEARLRWDLPAQGLLVEAGAAHFFHGGFQRDAPGGQNTDTTYSFLQLAWSF